VIEKSKRESEGKLGFQILVVSVTSSEVVRKAVGVKCLTCLPRKRGRNQVCGLCVKNMVLYALGLVISR